MNTALSDPGKLFKTVLGPENTVLFWWLFGLVTITVILISVFGIMYLMKYSLGEEYFPKPLGWSYRFWNWNWRFWDEEFWLRRRIIDGPDRDDRRMLQAIGEGESYSIEGFIHDCIVTIISAIIRPH